MLLKLAPCHIPHWCATSRSGECCKSRSDSRLYWSSSTRPVFAFCFALCLALFGCIANAAERSSLPAIIGTFSAQSDVPVSTLSISVSSVAFGSVSENAPVTQTVTLSSTGTAPVTVSAASVTGADFSLTQGTIPVTLSPGQTATITVQYDPTVLGAETGQLSISSTSSTNGTATIPLSGAGIPVLTDFTCASASISGTANDLCTLTLSGPAPAHGLRVVVSSNNSAVTTTTARWSTQTRPARSSLRLRHRLHLPRPRS